MTGIELRKTARLAVAGCISAGLAVMSLVCVDQSCGAELRPQDELAALQRRLATETEVCVRISLSVWGGIAVAKQPPIRVTLAWHKPDFYYAHVPAWGDNPNSWYWLDGGQLQICESWDGKKESRARAHGVRIANFSQLAGDGQDAAFHLAKDKAKVFDFVGDQAAKFLEVLQEAVPKAMTIEKRNSHWITKEKATDFKNPFVKDRLAVGKDDGIIVFDVVQGVQPLKAISIYPDFRERPDFCDTASFDTIEFALDRKKLVFPHAQDAIKPVEVKHRDKIDGDLLVAVPFTFLQAETKPERSGGGKR